LKVERQTVNHGNGSVDLIFNLRLRADEWVLPDLVFHTSVFKISREDVNFL
jgi:hypothetical protein